MRRSTRARPQRAWRFWLGALLLGLILSISRGASQAHAVPVGSTPATGAILAEAPTTVAIAFNEPVVPGFSQIQVLSQAGQPIATGPLEVLDADGVRVGVSLPGLAAGTYLVSWQVLSAVDGHTTNGSFPFGVGIQEITGANAQVDNAAPSATPLSAGTRWLSITGVALVLGLFAFRLLIWRPTMDVEDLEAEESATQEAFLRLGLIAGLVGVALLAIASVLIFISQSMDYGLLRDGNLGIWLGTRFGQMWLTRLALLLAGGGLLTWLSRGPAARRDRRYPDLVGLLLGLALAATVSLVSHSAALPKDGTVATLVDGVHVAAAGVWIGGLVQLALALGLARRLEPASRAWLNASLWIGFSALAAGAVGVLLASGVYLAVQHVGSWLPLVGTAYGRVLLAKLALALVPFAIAGVNLILVKPRLRRGFEQAGSTATANLQRGMRRLVWVEAIFGLLILASTGLLTDLQRAQDAPTVRGAGDGLRLPLEANDLELTMAISPALVGQNTFDVFLLDTNGEPVRDAREVNLRFTFLGRAIGTAEADLQDLGDGHFRLESNNISLSGPWQIEMAVRRPGAFDTFAVTRLEAGVDGRVTPAGAETGLINRAVTLLTRTNSLVPGVVLVLFALAWGFVANKAADRDWQLVPLLSISLLALWLGGSMLLQFSRDYTPAMFATNPITPDAGSIAAGKELFVANCVSCHGENGRGDGPAAVALPSRPADFTDGHTATHTDGDLFYWIKEGVEGTPMPAWSDQLEDEQIWHLVNYVRRLSVQSASS